MREEEAKALILSKISITRQKVIIAKANILEQITNNAESDQLITELLTKMDAHMPDEINLNQAVDPLPNIKKASESISWRVAASEAIWELVHENLLIPTTSDLSNNSIHLTFSKIYQHSGGSKHGCSFDEFFIPTPIRLIRSHSRKMDTNELLVNPDLYLHMLQIPNLHSEIKLSLQEAIQCFKFELYTASATMLGKASEGAWLELGKALIAYLPSDNQNQIRKQISDLENPNIGIGKKIHIVVNLYEHQDLYSSVAQKSGISIQELRPTATWSDTVRDSRNSIHFGVEPSIPNNYEKVAALLLGAVPNLRIIYQIINACL